MRDLIVETRVGKLRGKKETACNGTEYFSFNGIPYAKPPVGELRFRVSIPFLCSVTFIFIQKKKMI